MSALESTPEGRDAKLRRAMTPELIALVRSLPHPATEEDIPTLMMLAASLGLFGNDPFPLPLRKLPTEQTEKREGGHADA